MTNKRKPTHTVNTASSTIKTPRFPQHPLDKATAEESLRDQERYEQLHFTQHDLSEQHAHNVSFDQVLLQQVNMQKSNIKKLYLLDSRLKICDLANAEWPEANLARVELLECHLTGFQAPEGQFQDVLFKDCQAQFAQFANTIFKGVRFEDCDLREANFFEADLTGAIFIRCDLTSVDFSSAKLAGADLRGSKIDGMRVGPRELKGALIDMTQAVAFVRGLGIKVEPLPEKE